MLNKWKIVMYVRIALTSNGTEFVVIQLHDNPTALGLIRLGRAVSEIANLGNL